MANAAGNSAAAAGPLQGEGREQRAFRQWRTAGCRVAWPPAQARCYARLPDSSCRNPAMPDGRIFSILPRFPVMPHEPLVASKPVGWKGLPTAATLQRERVLPARASVLRIAPARNIDKKRPRFLTPTFCRAENKDEPARAARIRLSNRRDITMLACY
jgi:hypothetical protein